MVEEPSQDPCPGCPCGLDEDPAPGSPCYAVLMSMPISRSRCWTRVCGSLATLMSLHCFFCDINVRPTGLSPGRFHWRCGPQGGVTLIQLQGLPFVLDLHDPPCSSLISPPGQPSPFLWATISLARFSVCDLTSLMLILLFLLQKGCILYLFPRYVVRE